MSFLDRNPDVIEWGSEETVVPYWDPSVGRRRRYFLDFTIKRRGADGNVSTMLVEVKPWRETQPPVQGRNRKRYIEEVATYGRNVAKWTAAREYAEGRGWTFKVLTERELGILF